MSPANSSRRNSLYFLMLLNLIMLVCGLALTVYVLHLRLQVTETRAASRAGCERGNAVRTALNTVLRERLPLVECDKVYP